jgi:hypothetical protein
MPGDITRSTFNRKKNYSGVRQQQGRVQLDADWNEQVDINAHLRETGLGDAIGKVGAPHSGGGFKVSLSADATDLVLSPGRLYVDGVLCELDPPVVPVLASGPSGTGGTLTLPAGALEGVKIAAGDWLGIFDEFSAPLAAGQPLQIVQVQAVTDSGTKIALKTVPFPHTGTLHLLPLPSYTRQPDLPAPPAPSGTTNYFVYLDVWQRPITALEDPEICEVALGGPDTATRTQTVWQLKLLPVTLPDVLSPPVITLPFEPLPSAKAAPPADKAVASPAAPATGEVTLPPIVLAPPPIHCLSTPDAWLKTTAPSSGRLRARTKPPAPPDTPCIVPADAGYTRLENQLYRVEVHTGGDEKTATCKWSRENASVAVDWVGQDSTDPHKLTVSSTGRDPVLGLPVGVFVELIDDGRELRGEPGLLVQLTQVEGNVLTIDPLGQTVDFKQFSGHPKVRRWDQKNQALPDHALHVKVPASDADWLQLEGDIEIAFEPGTYRTGDYWLIPARAFIGEHKGDIEWPQDGSSALALPPHGIAHHYAKLAVVAFDGKVFSGLQDCRPVFPALTELVDFFPAGGDGQEAMPGEQLPCSLAVGVTNGRWPVAGARVQFEIDPGEGSLEAAAVLGGTSTGTRVVTSTGSDGIATCTWTFPATFTGSDAACFTATATLLDAADARVSTPISFHARQSLASEVAYRPGTCRHLAGTTTVQQALDRLCANVSLSYVGGDGQEAGPNQMLPQPLEVRVGNGGSPQPGAQVGFRVIEGKGRLDTSRPSTIPFTDSGIPVDTTTTARVSTATSPATGTSPAAIPPLIVGTDTAGLAFCFWTLSDDATDPRQRVEAVLLDAAGNPVPGQVVHFNAGFRETGKKAGLTVTAVKLISNGAALSNDTCIPVSQFSAGFRVTCSEPLADFFQTQLGPVATPPKPNVMAILYLPYPLVGDRLEWSTADNPLYEVVGYQPLLLAGNVSLDGADIVWAPWGPNQGKWLTDIFTNLIQFNQKVASASLGYRLLVQIILKGNFIWSKADSSRYLDGGVLGVAGPPDPFLFASPPTTALNLAAGSGRRGSDFEMWFWLAAIYIFQCRAVGTTFNTFTVSGSLQDTTGKGVPAIPVTLTGPSSVPPQKTDTNGNFSFPQVPPGTYTAQAQFPGVQPQKVTVPPSSTTSGAATPAAQSASLAKGEVVTPESIPETEAAKPSPAKQKAKTPKARSKPKPKK